jgi:hypothetical protein
MHPGNAKHIGLRIEREAAVVAEKMGNGACITGHEARSDASG